MLIHSAGTGTRVGLWHYPSFASGVMNDTQVPVEIQDDPTQIDFFLNSHERCPRYTTEKRTEVGTGQKSFGDPETLPGTGITDRRAAPPEGPA